jgi:hypothetical protein
MAMKYVKLFENWLLEAEGEVAKPATFDPKKPSKTLIVDISQENMAKLVPDWQASWLRKILNKAYYKKDTIDFDEELKVSVNYCTVGVVGNGREERGTQKKKNASNYASFKGLGEDAPFDAIKWKVVADAWDDGQLDETSDINTISFAELQKNKTPLFFVTLDGSTPETLPEKESDIYVFLKASTKSFILAPTSDSFKNGKDFAINSEFNIWTDNGDSYSTVTLGNLIMNIQNYLDNGGKLLDIKPKPQEIAKALGYEIPDNYAPGQGVKTTRGNI